MNVLIPKLTNAGLQALLSATNDGLDAAVSHTAFGDGDGDGYAPTGLATVLKNERARAEIGGGERVGDFEIEVQALLDTGLSFWIREVGFMLEDGTMLAVWSDPATPLAYKTDGVPLAVAYNLALEGIPPGSVTIVTNGPSVNLTIISPFAILSAEIIRAHRLGIAAESTRATPIIQNMWR